MKSTIYAASALLSLAAAQPQGPPHGGPPGGLGPFAAFPSCVDSCWQDIRNSASGCSAGDYSCLCTDDVITKANSCIEQSSCSASDKSSVYEAIAQLCANSGATVTASPEATWSVTSGGSAWPTAWTTNSAWTSAVSQWGGAPGGGPPGWNGGGGWGPFGHGGPNHGWGPWATASSGAWTNGPWTNWWGGSACPPSTWSGWTSGPWGTNAPWTTWSGCTASTTATSVVTNVVTTSGSTVTQTSTDFGIQVAQATNGGSAASSSTSPGAAMATNFRMAGSAAGVVGVVAGALLL
jgi:hypothetical protein